MIVRKCYGRVRFAERPWAKTYECASSVRATSVVAMVEQHGWTLRENGAWLCDACSRRADAQKAPAQVSLDGGSPLPSVQRR